jgi:hypothetical protein
MYGDDDPHLTELRDVCFSRPPWDGSRLVNIIRFMGGVERPPSAA